MVEVQLHSFLTSALEVSGQLQAPAALLPRKNRHWKGGWMGPHSRCGRGGGNSLPEIEPRFLGDGARSLGSIPSALLAFLSPSDI
jgi:hypothetical protein